MNRWQSALLVSPIADRTHVHRLFSHWEQSLLRSRVAPVRDGVLARKTGDDHRLMSMGAGQQIGRRVAE